MKLSRIFLALALSMGALQAQAIPPFWESGLEWLEIQVKAKGLRVDRGLCERSSGSIAKDCPHVAWGKDPESGRWEAVVILSPISPKKKRWLVHLKAMPKDRWSYVIIRKIPFEAECSWRVSALPAGVLAESWDPPLLAHQDPEIPSAPLEFHLDCEDEGLSSPAEILHPRLGTAQVVNTIVDDRKDPAPRGQTWGTHARGESLDLPASAFPRMKPLEHWKRRIWFRLDGELYAMYELDWKRYKKSFGTQGRKQ